MTSTTASTTSSHGQIGRGAPTDGRSCGSASCHESGRDKMAREVHADFRLILDNAPGCRYGHDGRGTVWNTTPAAIYEDERNVVLTCALCSTRAPACYRHVSPATTKWIYATWDRQVLRSAARVMPPRPANGFKAEPA